MTKNLDYIKINFTFFCLILDIFNKKLYKLNAF